MSRILIVEDDERLAALTREYLEMNGLEVSVEDNGLKAISRIVDEQPDLVVLDLMLPGADGITVCREVRDRFPNPILMLTARVDDLDQVLGLEMGADDYVCKPVKPRVLHARIKALLRRSERGPVEDPEPDTMTVGDLYLDNIFKKVTRTTDGETLDLTAAEFDLLWILFRNPGVVLTRDELFEKLKGIPYDGQDRSLDVRVSRIRSKIGDDPDDPKMIRTVRSKGYVFVGALQR
jgi:two-component system response regulator RstA